MELQFDYNIFVGNAATGTGSTTWTKLAEVTNISGGGFEADDVDVTTKDVTDKVKKTKAGLTEVEPVEVECGYTVDAFDDANALYKVERGFKIEKVGGSEDPLIFDGYVKGISLPEFGLEDGATFTVTIKPNTMPTRSA